MLHHKQRWRRRRRWRRQRHHNENTCKTFIGILAQLVELEVRRLIAVFSFECQDDFDWFHFNQNSFSGHFCLHSHPCSILSSLPTPPPSQIRTKCFLIGRNCPPFTRMQVAFQLISHSLKVFVLTLNSAPSKGVENSFDPLFRQQHKEFRFVGQGSEGKSNLVCWPSRQTCSFIEMWIENDRRETCFQTRATKFRSQSTN